MIIFAVRIDNPCSIKADGRMAVGSRSERRRGLGRGTGKVRSRTAIA